MPKRFDEDDPDALVLTCVERDCGATFRFGGGEKGHFDRLGYPPPVRCPACRARKRAERDAASFDTGGDGGNQWRGR